MRGGPLRCASRHPKPARSSGRGPLISGHADIEDIGGPRPYALPPVTLVHSLSQCLHLHPRRGHPCSVRGGPPESQSSLPHRTDPTAGLRSPTEETCHQVHCRAISATSRIDRIAALSRRIAWTRFTIRQCCKMHASAIW